MFNHYKVSALVLALAAAGAAQATQSLKVTIAQPTNSTAKETGVVVITLTNDGDEPVDILKPLTPFAQIPTGQLPGAIFSVKDGRGHQARYVGDSGKYLNFTTNDFIHLLPGQSISKTIDLSKDYKLSNGPYTISYDQDYSTKRPEQRQIVKNALDPTNSIPRKHSVSNTLQIWVNGSLLQAKQLQTKQEPNASSSSALMISPLNGVSAQLPFRYRASYPSDGHTHQCSNRRDTTNGRAGSNYPEALGFKKAPGLLSRLWVDQPGTVP